MDNSALREGKRRTGKTMQKTNTDFINDALDILDHTLQDYVEARLKVRYGQAWQDALAPNVRRAGGVVQWDTQALLGTMLRQWRDVFQEELGFAGKNWVGELKEWRNEVAHRSPQKPLNADDADRAIDTARRLLALVAPPQAHALDILREQLRAQTHSRPAAAPVHPPVAPTKRREGTHAEQIMRAVATLVGPDGAGVFTRDDVRHQAGVPSAEWNPSYSPTFQGMRADHPGGAPRVAEPYQKVFARVGHGQYVLTETGRRRVCERKSVSA